jgi:putative transposase
LTAYSHPFVERLIGSVRRELLDQTLFWTATDLQNKLDHFQEYYNNHRGHSSLGMKTPRRMAEENTTNKNVVSLGRYHWESRCNGLYQLPAAA